MIGSALIGILGIVLIALANYDAIKTTLSASSSGPFTNRFISQIWAVLLFIHKRYPNHQRLAAVGPWMTVGLMITWLLFILLGWWLLFCASPFAVVNADTQQPADAIERLYYAGYTLTTLGYGDYVPGSDGWRMAPIIAAANGFFLFTLTITYMLNIVANVTEKRQTALNISALGTTPWQILEATHANGQFSSLSQQLQILQPSIGKLGQQHLAYPILHYYHDKAHDKSLALALTRLYQALLIARESYPDIDSATKEQMTISLKIIEGFIATLDSAFIKALQHPPNTHALETYSLLPDIRLSPEGLKQLLNTEHQKVLAAYVHKDGWKWGDVWSNSRTE